MCEYSKYINTSGDVINAEENNGKTINVFHIFALYVLMLLIYWMDGSPISLVGYFIVGVWSYFNPLLLLSLLGASNYLPAVLGLSPLLISICLMIVIIILRTKLFRIVYTSLDWRIILLILIVMWSLMSGMTQQDMSFMGSMITAFICYIILKAYLDKFETQSSAILHLATGIGFGIVLAFLIKLGISGFASFHPFRLAIGERADPNSTGLLMAIFFIYSFIQFTNKLGDSFKKALPYLVFILLGLWVLLLTQSRGSILCAGITAVIYLLCSKKRRVGSKEIFIVLELGLCAAIILILAGNSALGALGDALEQFIFRVETNSSVDGERLYLLEQSFKSFFENPIFGTSLSDFEFIAGHVPHNTFSDYMVTNGIIGIVFFIVMYTAPIISMYPFKKTYRLNLAYYCYFVCFFNILFYSASNEKITIILLVILMHSIKQEKNIVDGLNT